MDINVEFNTRLLKGDIQVAGADLARDDSLRTAVVLSLFTDRLAEEDDELPHGEKDRRGWWGDALAFVDEDKIGSRRWIYKREKQTIETARKIREADEEALQWLVDDGIAVSVNVTTEWVKRGCLDETIIIEKPDGDTLQFEFNELWETV